MSKRQNNQAHLLTAGEILECLNRDAKLLHQFGVTKIGLFGSFLHRSSHSRSDIDFLVAFDQPTFDRYMELKFYLEDLFGRKVDLVIEQDLKPALHYLRKEAVYAEAV
jgi:predicted nucleotidyltransferase